MLNLNSTIDLNFKQFFRWWKRELVFLIPERIKPFFNNEHGFIIIRTMSSQLVLPRRRATDKRDYHPRVTSSQLALTYRLLDQDEPLATLERSDRSFSIQSLYEKDLRLAKAKVILRLSSQEAIQKELSLPIAAKENLHQVISYELDRYTPFKAEQVYFAVKPLTGENEPGYLRVMIIVTTRELLDGLYEDVKAMGISPLFVDYQDAPNSLDDIDEAYNLLPEKFRQKTANLPRLLNGALITLTSILLILVIAMPVWFEYQTVNTLKLKAESLEKDAKKVKAMQSSIDAVIDETSQLIKEKNASPDVINILNTLSLLIKDDTSLNYAQYSEGHLQIQGESPTASALLAVLEESELFSNARFASPVTQDRVSNLERFQITVDVINTNTNTNTNTNANANAQTEH